VGASAGGLEALEAFFGGMPATTGMAFVVVQHLSPDYKSLMVELLSKHTRMPVRRADEEVVVEPDTVYLIPPKKNLEIEHGHLKLTDKGHVGVNLPIDIFFRSLAEDQAERGIGVILSGTGTDGMRGVRAPKEAGGLIVAQEPTSARFDGMPRAAISTGLVDYVLPPEAMAERLVRFANQVGPWSGASVVEPLLKTKEDGLAAVLDAVRKQTNVDFTHYKPGTVLRRLERRMHICQTESLEEYVHLIRESPREVTTLFKELLIGVTKFFRDVDAFEAIGAEAIAKAEARRRALPHGVRALPRREAGRRRARRAARREPRGLRAARPRARRAARRLVRVARCRGATGGDRAGARGARRSRAARDRARAARPRREATGVGRDHGLAAR
jgi:two-component system CheB/CheR fusion protein